MEQVLILILILGLIIKDAITGKEKKITLFSIAIIPILFIYLIMQNLKLTVSIPEYYYIAFAAATVVGIIFGIFRSKFYTYRINENGEVLYKRQITDAIIFVIYIFFDIVIKFVCKYYDANLLNLISTALLFVAAPSITSRRVIMFLTYTKLLKAKDLV